MMTEVIQVAGDRDHGLWQDAGAPREYRTPSARHFRHTRAGAYCAALAIGVILLSAPVSAQQERFELVSVTRQGRPVFDGNSNQPSTSFDGRFIAFASNSPDIFDEPDDIVEFDVYVRDRELLIIQRISNAVGGGEPNGDSQAPAISAGGRYVAFASTASNLVEGDDNGFEDVFLHDRETGVTELISVGVDDSPADGPSTSPAISADGQLIVYQSQADNLVPGEDTSTSDIYVFDRNSGETRRVSVAMGKEPTDGPSITAAISADGSVVTFISAATNLIPDDTSTVPQVFVAELESGTIERVSVSSAGVPANRISFLPALNADGSLVAFKSEAFNLVPNDTNGVPDVFVRDRTKGTTVRISVDDFGNQSNGLSGPPSMSNDGCDVAFPSAATNLVLNDANDHTDVFVVDRCGRNEQIIFRIGSSLGPLAPNGDVPDAPPSLSRNGQWLSFTSTATDLVSGVTGNNQNVYITGNPLNPPPTEPTPTPTDTATPTPPPMCTKDQDCPEGEVCDPVTWMCVTPTPTPTVSPTPTGRCTNNDDCPPGQVCDPTTNMCVTPSPTPTPTGRCTNNDDCPPGQVCDPTTNMCVTPSPTPTPTGRCTNNDDCPPGQVCDPETNMCVTPSPTRTVTPTPPECTNNEDCPPGEVCDPNTNMCVPSATSDDGCSCEIHPSERHENPLTPLALMLPALALWLRRRAGRRARSDRPGG